MARFAPNDAAERDGGLVRLAAIFRPVERDRESRRNFERAGHGEHIASSPRFRENGKRALQEPIGDIRSRTRLDDQATRPVEVWDPLVSHGGARASSDHRRSFDLLEWRTYLSPRPGLGKSGLVRSGLGKPGLGKPCRVAGHEIDLEIQPIAGPAFPERRRVEAVRDEEHG